jgi:serine/threonine protein phosphatase PrpC
MPLRLAWATDPGLERDQNEDSVFVSEDAGRLDALLLVADGMGGHASGQVASKIVADTISGELRSDGGLDPQNLAAAFARANTAVYEAARATSENAGMGSTVVMAAVKDGRMAMLNVGDSPAYLFRSGTVTEIYQNHSWPSEQARAGIIKPEDVANHPMKHRLARAVGVWDHVKPYTTQLELEPGDVVLLCSDGVEEAGVSTEELRGLLEGEDLEAAVKSVIALCRQRGAPDNVSVAALRVE